MTAVPLQLDLPGFDQDLTDWRESYKDQIGDDPVIRNRSGVEIRPLYSPEDWNGDRYLDDLGFPGKEPYTRGIYPTMYRGRLWSMRQYAGYGTAAESNRRYRYLLEQGVTGLSVAFDLPTQIGFDSDHLLAAGEVGRVGVGPGEHYRWHAQYISRQSCGTEL